MFGAFMGNPSTQICISMNIYTIIYFKFIKIILITIPTKLRPHEPEPINIYRHK